MSRVVMDREREDTVIKRARRFSLPDDGLAADRAKHPVRNAIVLVLTLVTFYTLFGLECDGSRSTCRTRHGGASAIPAGLIVLVLAASLWRMPAAEAARLVSVPGQSLGIMRSMPALGGALVSGGIWFLAESFNAGSSPVGLAGLVIFVPSAVLAITTGRWGVPPALVPPPLRGTG